MGITVLVNGAKGKMGRLAVQAIQGHPSLECVAGIGREDSLPDLIKQHQPQVVLDLTEASVARKHADIILDHGAHPVIGTSGLTQDDVDAITQRCENLKVGGLIIPNFSLGATLMMQAAKQIARFYEQAEIIEYHHPQKKDAPSGTAMKTAELMRAGMTHPAAMPQLETIPGSRGALYDQIPIHAVRIPGISARQDVVFGASGETLTLSHNTLDRQAYMPGVCLACAQVVHLQTCYYGLEHIIDGLYE